MICEKILDPSDGSEMFVFDLGGGGYGITYGDPGYPVMEFWHNHDFDGSGCNNLEITAFGEALDLEFCSSRDMTAAEIEALEGARHD